VRHLDAILFDLDDTLYPEREYVRSGMGAVADWAHAQFGCDRDQTASELWQLFEAYGSGTVFDRWLLQRGLNVADCVPKMVEVYGGHEPTIVLYTGVRELLARLRDKYRLAIVTDGLLGTQTRKVAALGIERCFDAIVYSDVLGREYWKPSVRPYEMALQQLAVCACDAMYVADNPAKDFRGARELGMRTVRVRYEMGLRCRDEAPDDRHAPDTEITDLRMLEEVIDGACAAKAAEI
jgi:putative hydrolase of the HAD superfamily